MKAVKCKIKTNIKTPKTNGMVFVDHAVQYKIELLAVKIIFFSQLRTGNTRST